MVTNTDRSAAGNPVPLGLACFAVAVFIFSGYLWGSLQSEAVVTTAFFVGGLGMLMAAVAAYRRGDTLEATWMGAYSVFWAAIAFYMWFFMAHSTNLNADMGWLAVAWGVFTAYIFVASLRAKSGLVSLQLLLFFIFFLFMWIASAFHMPLGFKVAAVAGLATAIAAAVESFVLTWTATTGEAPSLTRLGGTGSGRLEIPHTP